MANRFNYPQGSIWRKWDLHVHTPFSYLNNQFGNDFDDYVKQLFKKAIEKSIAAIGITDYFTIDGYKKLKNEYLNENGKLEELQFSKEEIEKIKKILIVPNIEFRLNKLVGNQRINFHVIFSSDIQINDIEENFLREIKFVYEGGPQTEDEKRSLTLQNLDDLGKKLKSEHEKFKNKSNKEIGMMNAVVDDTEIIKILSNKRSIFEGKYLILVPADEDLSQISWNGQDHQTRKVLIQKCDGLFASNKNTIEWALGKKHSSPQDFINEFKSLKPCLWGSDAHTFEKLFEPDANRYTWIKADPTFEGLKQILYEPEERVYIGLEPPRNIERDKIIRSITISNSNSWFDDKTLLLNEGLVTIIGGKGTGKTAILDLIAYATKSYKSNETGSSSFLKRAQKELKGTNIKVEWDNNDIDKIAITNKLEDNFEGKVRYLPQDFTNQLCSEIGENEIEKQIENVIFQKIPLELRAGYSDFSSYKTSQLRVINDNKERVRQKISELNSNIHDLNKNIKQEEEKNKEREKIEKQIKTLEDEINKINLSLKDSQEQQQLLNNFNSKAEEKSTLEKIISNLNANNRKIEEIKNSITHFREYANKFSNNLRNELISIGINQEDIEKIKVVLHPENIENIIDSKKNEFDNEIDDKNKKLNNLKKEIVDIETQINLEKTLHDKIKSINNSLSELKQRKESLEKEIKKIDTDKEDLKNKLSERDELFIKYFILLFEEKERLKEIYLPLTKALKLSNEENVKIFDFSVKFNFDIDTMANEGHELIDLRAEGLFRQTKPEALKMELEKIKFSVNLDDTKLSDTYKNSIKNFIYNVIELFTKNGNSISSQLKEKSYTEKDFDNWLFNTKYYSVNYSIKFNNTELENLSPGLKGVALLILFLELDKDDKRPILIDQPEENLDNRSVFNTLVKYFREAKKRRQVIIATHNPNLVVNTDSEQVIVANLDKDLSSQSSRINYVSGSLENTFKDQNNRNLLEKQGIREHVCEILEGGKEAFEKREKKYGFR